MANYTYSRTTVVPPYRRRVTTPEFQPQLPTLEQVLDGPRTIPAYSLVLGMCDDQLPLVLDLTEPASGSFLVAGDSGFANTSLLHSMIASAFYLNTENEVNLHLISPQADSLTHFHRQPIFKISYQPGKPEIELVLEEMGNLVEERKTSGRRAPYHLLFIDSLDILWDSLSSQARMWLNWLTTYSAQYGLRVIASLETDYLKPDLYRTVDCFPSRILGQIQFINDAKYLSGRQGDNLSHLTPELEFIAFTEGQAFNLLALPTENYR
jgi:hypothetical protein